MMKQHRRTIRKTALLSSPNFERKLCSIISENLTKMFINDSNLIMSKLIKSIEQ